MTVLLFRQITLMVYERQCFSVFFKCRLLTHFNTHSYCDVASPEDSWKISYCLLKNLGYDWLQCRYHTLSCQLLKEYMKQD